MPASTAIQCVYNDFPVEMMQIQTKKHSIKGCSITVKLQPPHSPFAIKPPPLSDQPDIGESETECDTLEVSGLPPKADKEILKMYFERRKCGGCDGAVVDITSISSGVAQVKFKSPKGSCTLPSIKTLMCVCV